jgi:hypothetical protein
MCLFAIPLVHEHAVSHPLCRASAVLCLGKARSSTPRGMRTAGSSACAAALNSCCWTRCTKAREAARASAGNEAARALKAFCGFRVHGCERLVVYRSASACMAVDNRQGAYDCSEPEPVCRIAEPLNAALACVLDGTYGVLDSDLF